MHIPDGFVATEVALACAVPAAVAVGVGLRRANVDLDERRVPLLGVTAAFVFAAQMLNFPVAGGTSGHFMGAALAAILLGPWLACLVLAVVLGVQAFVFADGGLTALGTNVTLLGLVAIAVGWAVFRLLTAVLPTTRGSVLAVAGTAALVSVPVAALAFVGLFAVGGVADVAVGTVAAAMGGVHVLIGLGEAAITVAVVGAVLAVRPDLVHGARALRRAALLAERPTSVPAGAR